MLFSKKILTWLYPLFAFLLPLQTRWIIREREVGDSIWEYGRVSVYGFDLALACIGLLVLVNLLSEKIRVENVKRAWAIGAASIVLVVYELGVSLDPVLTAVVLARVALMLIAGWYLIRLDSMVLRRTLAAFVAGMVLSAGLGVAQFFTQDYLISSKWLGMSPQEPSVLGVSVVEAAGGRWLRAHGTMPHPNAFGGFSSVALILFLTFFATQMRPSVEKNLFLGFCRNVFFAITPLILLAGVVTAVSRAAILATIAGGIALVWQARNDVRYKSLVPWVKGMAVAGLLVVLLAGPVAFTRLTAHGRLEALSFTKRIAAFEEAWATAHVYGVLGTGLGAGTVALRNLYPQLPIWEIQPVHNVPILLIVELGLGGLLITAIGLYLVFSSSKLKTMPRTEAELLVRGQNSPQESPGKSGHPTGQAKLMVFAPLMVTYVVVIMLDHYLWTLPAGLYLTGMVAWAGRGLDRG